MRLALFFGICFFSVTALSADSASESRVDVAVFFAIDDRVVAWPMFSVSQNGIIDRNKEGTAEQAFKSPPCLPRYLAIYEKTGGCETLLSIPTEFYGMTTAPSLWFDQWGKSHKPVAGFFQHARDGGGPDTFIGFLLQSDNKDTLQIPIALSSQPNVYAVRSSKKLRSLSQFPELRGLLKQWREKQSGSCSKAAEELTKSAYVHGEIVEYKLPSGRRLQNFVGGSSIPLSAPARSANECFYVSSGSLNIVLWRIIGVDGSNQLLHYYPEDGIEFVHADCDTQCPDTVSYEVLEVNGTVLLVGMGSGGTASGFNALKLERKFGVSSNIPTICMNIRTDPGNIFRATS